MRMNQNERRFDFHGLGLALKRAREEKGWTQAYVAELVDRDSRTIMNIENKGQYPSFDLFVKLITMFDISVDQFIHADGGGPFILKIVFHKIFLTVCFYTNCSIVSNLSNAIAPIATVIINP